MLGAAASRLQGTPPFPKGPRRPPARLKSRSSASFIVSEMEKGGEKGSRLRYYRSRLNLYCLDAGKSLFEPRNLLQFAYSSGSLVVKPLHQLFYGSFAGITSNFLP